MCAPFCHVALLMTLETSSFLHVLFAFFIRKLLEREGCGGINVHSIGVSCFWAVMSSVLGGSRVSSSWSNGDELETLGLCSSSLLPIRHIVTSRNRSIHFSLFYPCLTFSLRLMVTHRLDSCDHLLYRLVTRYVLVSLLLL